MGNMKSVFVTFGDANYRQSLLRIKAEAEQTGLFDCVRCYTPDDLPDTFNAYARRYKRGYGYWMWKPWIIRDALRDVGADGVVVYADAGCKVFAHSDWHRYFRIMEKKKGLFFIAPGKNRRWCKRAVPEFFHITNKFWQSAHQIQATFMIVRHNDVIERWCNLAEEHAELFIDVPEDQRHKENPKFREHRHDQSVLTACVCTSADFSALQLMPEKLEYAYAGGQAVFGGRLADAGSHAPVRHTKSKMETWMERLLAPFVTFETRMLYRLCSNRT